VQWRHTAAPPIRDYVAGIVSAPGLISNEFRPTPGGPFGLGSAVTLEPRAFNMGYRPIGMERLVSAPDRFSFQPRVLVLTYEGAPPSHVTRASAPA
jgi:hypothetical protein